jgi:tetratricopeptide (TPR) repeat protein
MDMQRIRLRPLVSLKLNLCFFGTVWRGASGAICDKDFSCLATPAGLRLANAKLFPPRLSMPSALGFISFILAVFLPLAAFGQISEEEILALLEQNDLSTARKRVSQVYRQHQGSATAAYFHALLQEDAGNAAKLFEEIASRFRGTPYAERALFRLGQFHFANGTYTRARQYFLNLAGQYPSSRLVPQAQYYAAKSLVIIGKLGEAYAELSRCTENYPGTWVAIFAAEDLANLRTPSNHKANKPTTKPAAPYTVQIGSFAQRENAVNQQRFFSQAGYRVEIYEKKEGRKVFYQVRVGEFSDRNQAREFADEMQRKFKLRCHVVKRNEK